MKGLISPFCLLGWVAVLLGLLVRYNTAGFIVTAMLALSTLCLLKRPAFPKRKEGIAMSWLGPFLIIAWHYLPFLYLSSTMSVKATISFMVMCYMLFTAMLLSWLTRGYGIIPPLALLSIVFPDRNSEIKLGLLYPAKKWWVIPLSLCALGCVLSVLVYILL